MSLLSTLDYDFGMCKPIWKIIDGYFTIPKIKSAKLVCGTLEISFEDKDSTPFRVATHGAHRPFVIEEIQCVYWNTLCYVHYAWNAYNLRTNELVTTRYDFDNWCCHGWILKPLPPKIDYEKKDIRVDWNQQPLPETRARDYIAIHASLDPVLYFFTDWKMGCVPSQARVI
jgi:hypothetical protein